MLSIVFIEIINFLLFVITERVSGRVNVVVTECVNCRNI